MNPSNEKRSVGSPESTSADNTALGPGITVIEMFSSIAFVTNR